MDFKLFPQFQVILMKLATHDPHEG